MERQLDNGEIDDDGEPVEISDEPELKQSIGRRSGSSEKPGT